jgi:hypothetical protein
MWFKATQEMPPIEIPKELPNLEEHGSLVNADGEVVLKEDPVIASFGEISAPPPGIESRPASFSRFTVIRVVKIVVAAMAAIPRRMRNMPTFRVAKSPVISSARSWLISKSHFPLLSQLPAHAAVFFEYDAQASLRCAENQKVLAEVGVALLLAWAGAAAAADTRSSSERRSPSPGASPSPA